MKHKKLMAAVLSAAMCFSSLTITNISFPKSEITAEAASVSDMPTEYQYAADWIWNTRIVGEGSVVSHATIYDQIIAGKGTLNYIVRWQSYKNITLQQRKQLQTVIETAVNDWNKWLAGYENWPYEHVNVKIVGWAVLDKNCLLDLQPDEKVYTDVDYYDPSGDINAGMANSSMPSLMPKLPVELYRYEHWNDANYQYPGGYENRFDMHLTGSTGMIDMGGYGYYWGQQLSDNAVLGLADGTTSVHILEHEIGHGFGFTDFYGGEGESDGFPPGGFPGGSSIMMAGSSSVITDFDGWFARYVWTKISAESGRFDLSNVQPQPAEPVTPPYEEPANGYFMGDINSDGQVNISDAVLLQKWILAVPEISLPNWKAGDLCKDDKLDVFDLSLLKRLLLSSETPEWVGTGTSEPNSNLIPATVSEFGKLTPSTGDCRMLSIFVEFADTKYSRALPIETVNQELFGSSNSNYPYDSISDWYERASYGNLHIDGDAYYYTLPGNMADYMNDDRIFEDFAMAVLSGLDAQINYADYDANNDGIIDCISIGVPLDNADQTLTEYWWGCTATWWGNPDFSVDGKKLNKFIILDVSPYADTMENAKSVLSHEMGHSLGLPDYYLYNAGNDWEAYHGDAGFERMDDSIGDFSSFSKLMYGWLREDEVQWYSGGTQSFTLQDSSTQGSCLIVPINSEVGNFTSEYFLIEYVTHSGNNAELDRWTNDSGVRIFHINAELIQEEWSGLKNFKYEGFSQYYQGNDRFRITRLVNEGKGFYHTGDVCTYGTEGFAGYDANGYQTVNTGYTIEIGELTNDGFTVTVRR